MTSVIHPIKQNVVVSQLRLLSINKMHASMQPVTIVKYNLATICIYRVYACRYRNLAFINPKYTLAKRIVYQRWN